MDISLDTPITFLKGVGQAKEKLYNKLNIYTIEDLLYHIPRDYVDLTSPVALCDAEVGTTVTVRGIVARKSPLQQIRPGLFVSKATVVDGEDSMVLNFFNNKFAAQGLEVDKEYIFHGRLENGYNCVELKSPTYYPTDSQGLIPVYPQTAGLTSKTISTQLATAIVALPPMVDSLPKALRERANVIGLGQALLNIHAPDSWADVQLARRRLAFDELLIIAMGVVKTGKKRRVANALPMSAQDISPLLDTLPFTPTDGQSQAINQSMIDMQSGTIMNRLVQGDVGSGKTLVALCCCYYTILNGYSAALMAPTEILAEQHYENISKILNPLGITTALLTGSVTAKNKKILKERLANGEINFCIGTHALLTADTHIKDLGLVVTDEQHRFGVSQRMALSQKGEEIHTLVMSATPIPRTLGLILYGDMEISVIKQMPKGREEIATYLIDDGKRTRAWGYVKDHLDKGQQGYIVCPLVEDDPETNTKGKQSAIEWKEMLETGYFSQYKVGLLHGKMKPKEKDEVMKAFAKNEIQLLVATTVIEVGIDVPNATIMMIENSENFGLSQLHQLRGRVGRGSEKSTCILVSASRNPSTIQRLKTLASTTDGFAIAEYDMEERGIGDFFGVRQHGLPTMGVANLLRDSQLLETAKEIADYILEKDSELEHLPVLAKKMAKMMNTAAVL